MRGTNTAHSLRAACSLLPPPCSLLRLLSLCLSVPSLQYRVVQEGIDAIFPYMTRQLLRPPFADFMQLLLKGSILIKHLQHRQDLFARQLMEHSAVQPGCVVLAVDGDRLQALTGQTLAMAAWKTQHSLALMIPEQERTSLTNLLTHRQPHSRSSGHSSAGTESSSHNTAAGGTAQQPTTVQTVQENGSSMQQSEKVGGGDSVAFSGTTGTAGTAIDS